MLDELDHPLKGVGRHGEPVGVEREAVEVEPVHGRGDRLAPARTLERPVRDLLEPWRALERREDRRRGTGRAGRVHPVVDPVLAQLGDERARREGLELVDVLGLDVGRHPVVGRRLAEDPDAVGRLDVADRDLVADLAQRVVRAQRQRHLVAKVRPERDRRPLLDVRLDPGRDRGDRVVPGRGRRPQVDREREQRRRPDQAE